MNDINNAERLLKEYFGHAAFRKGQAELVGALLSGRDVLGVMPTGAGKSVCYQLPAMMLPGMTLVISPLISLMKDQVAALRQAGIRAAFINSSLTAEEYREVMQGAYQGAYRILYVAPERLASGGFWDYCMNADISLIAIDEAHCVSQWGQDFRPSYLKIMRFIGAFERRPAVGAFTATATSRVKEDIKKLLGLNDPLEITTGFDRPNLYFDVVRGKKKIAWLHEYLSAHRGQSGIVYCATRKNVEAVCEFLRQKKLGAVRYHAGLSDEERKANQEAFVYDRSPIIVATNAFGMGIDKSNVSFVIHYNMPQSLEAYYQEAGRAGRDGSPADCILLFSHADVQTAKYLILKEEENDELSPEERRIVQRQDLQRLDRMTAYCKTGKCFRKALLDYFGEAAPDTCGNCGNCVSAAVETDITVEAQKILSAVTRVERRFDFGLGVTLIVRMLHGGADQRVLALGLDSMPTYGIMRDTDRPTIRAYIDHLVQEGYLLLTADAYPVLHTTDKARDVLFHGEKVYFTSRKEKADKTAKQTPSEAPVDLFNHLRKLRAKLASQDRVPAYIVLSNASLQDMAHRQPRTRAELLAVSGIGQYKAEKYGEPFLRAIAEWEALQNRPAEDATPDNALPFPSNDAAIPEVDPILPE